MNNLKEKIYFQMLKLKFRLKSKDARVPVKASSEETGYDLTAISICKRYGKKTILYDTGVCVEPPPGYYTEIVPRSSIIKTGHIMANNIGIIDQGYRNTLKIAVTHIDESLPPLELPFTKFQLIVRKLIPTRTILVNNLTESIRDQGGFGSTD